MGNEGILERIAPDIFSRIGNVIRDAAGDGGYSIIKWYHDELTRWVLDKYDGKNKCVQVQVGYGDNFPNNLDYGINIRAEIFNRKTRKWKHPSYNHTIPIPMVSFGQLGEIDENIINEVKSSLEDAIKKLDEK
jgi:hypothetical protein